MQRVSVLARWSVVLLVLGVFGGTMLEAAAPEPLLLTGEYWQAMAAEAKIAYISGVGNLVEYERHQLEAPPAERPRKSFLPYLARGLSGISINEVVSRVDHYYATYPDQLKRPVVDAIFQSVVLPRKTCRPTVPNSTMGHTGIATRQTLRMAIIRASA